MPFVEWLYQQDLTDLQALPDTVEVEGFVERVDRLRALQPQPKFDVGDRVKIVELLDSTTTKELIGVVGIVREVDPLANGHFNYYIGGAGRSHYMHEEELEPA